MSEIPALRRPLQEDCCPFEDSMDCGPCLREEESEGRSEGERKGDKEETLLQCSCLETDLLRFSLPGTEWLEAVS